MVYGTVNNVLGECHGNSCFIGGGQPVLINLGEHQGLEICADGIGFYVPPVEILALPSCQMLRRPSLCSGDREVRPQVFRGALLADVLEGSIGLTTLAPEARRCCVVFASGADGYRCAFSWGELFNNDSGGGILIAYACERVGLSPEVGPLALVAINDRDSGPRFVKQLRTIELKSF